MPKPSMDSNSAANGFKKFSVAKTSRMGSKSTPGTSLARVSKSPKPNFKGNKPKGIA